MKVPVRDVVFLVVVLGGAGSLAAGLLASGGAGWRIAVIAACRDHAIGPGADRRPGR